MSDLFTRGDGGDVSGSRWLRWAAGFVWLYTGLAVVHPYYREVGKDYLDQLGLPEWVMMATCAGEVLLGLRVSLGRAVAWVTVVQIVLVLGFTVILAWLDPFLLVNPYGILNKNVPLLAVIGTAFLVEREGWTSRALWLLRAGLACIWITEGLFPKILFLQQSEIDVVRDSGMSPVDPALFVQLLGLALAVGGMGMLILPGRPLRWLLVLQMAALLFLPLSVGWQDPHLWVHPFGPLIKNVPILVGTAVLFYRLGVTHQQGKRPERDLDFLLLGFLIAFPAVGVQAIAQNPPATAHPILRPQDLTTEAMNAHPAAAALFRELAQPADQVTFRDGKTVLVQPLRQFIGARPSFSGTLELEVVDGAATRTQKVASGDLASVTPYEDIVLGKVRRFRQTEAQELSAQEKLEASARVVQAVLRFHEGMRRRPLGGPDPWADVHTRLSEELLDIRQQQLDMLTTLALETNAWPPALSLADKLFAVYAGENSIKARVRKLWSAHGIARLKNNDWHAARQQLTRIEEQFLLSPEADALRQALQKQAEALAQETVGLPDKTAIGKLQQGLTLWPRLPGLRDALLQRQKAYPILYVAVRSLPEFLSPATAWTDTEKQAVELLFEGLIHPSDDTQGRRFWPGLAEKLPAVQPGTRRFTLVRDAYWSDGERLTTADVRHTMQLLHHADSPGRSPRCNDLVELPRVAPDSFSVEVSLRTPVSEPLTLLSFKLLPQQFRGKALTRADDPVFAKAPVGSGPFQYLGQGQQGQRVYADFGANPHYVRAGRSGLPLIREIHLFAWKNIEDLRGLPHPVHLVLDAATDQLSGLRALGVGEIRSVPSRRVYLLAVNHRVPTLKDQHFRRALAHGIDRQKILTRHFRGGKEPSPVVGVIAGAAALVTQPVSLGHPDFHGPANGPYPSKSWASCPPPRVPADLYDADLARTYARQALPAGSAVELTMKYPDDDPRLGAALQETAEQMEKLAAAVKAQLTVKLVALPPRQLWQALDSRDFDLLYHHVDRADETYELFALFDPHPEAIRAGGANYLGYEGDAKLQSLLQSALSQRRPAALQETMHNLHVHLHERMPLIPLWELHTHAAVHPQLAAEHMDPLLVFTHAAEWKVRP